MAGSELTWMLFVATMKIPNDRRNELQQSLAKWRGEVLRDSGLSTPKLIMSKQECLNPNRERTLFKSTLRSLQVIWIKKQGYGFYSEPHHSLRQF